MPQFDSTLLSRFYLEGENVFSDSTPFLVDRISLDITAHVATYTLPDYVRSIKRITYQGTKLEPLNRRSQRDAFQNATQIGTPFWYVYNNIGLNKIILFPTPPLTIAVATGNLWKSAAITAGVIIEFYRVTDNNIFVLPPWIKRQLLKQYVQMKAFAVDGAGINMKLVQYFTQRWEVRSQEFSNLLNEVHSKPRKLILQGIANSNFFPASPMWPIDKYGISVGEGE